MDPHVKMATFTAEVNMSTAWYKKNNLYNFYMTTVRGVNFYLFKVYSGFKLCIIKGVGAITGMIRI